MLGDRMNSAAGGGKASEKDEDMLDKGTFHTSPHSSFSLLRCYPLPDPFKPVRIGSRMFKRATEAKLDAAKGIDFVQEKFLGQGPQNNESAFEQAKDEKISDFIRGKYKSMVGSDMPIKDKKRFGE